MITLDTLQFSKNTHKQGYKAQIRTEILLLVFKYLMESVVGTQARKWKLFEEFLWDEILGEF